MGGSPRSWFVLAAVMAVLVGQSRSDIEQDKAECMDQLIGLATCLPYVGGEAKAPTFECCSGAKQVVVKSMKCLCILIKDRDDKSLGITVNISKALNLPASCHATANLTKCIDLMHLPLNSTEAKVYEDFAKSILPKNTTVPAANAPSSAVDARRELRWDSNVKLVKEIVTVSQDGSGDFLTIMDAVNAVPVNNDGSRGYFLIYVTAGIYQEYVSIGRDKSYLVITGDGKEKTIITGNRSATDGWGIDRSATFAVEAANFVGANLTVRNTAGPEKRQAVALRNAAQRSAFHRCSFEGYQDTLYAQSSTQFYRECDVYGTIDFIFGDAAVVLQSCDIYVRLPSSGQFNAITAQGRQNPSASTGITIHSCRIWAAADLAASNRSVETYLGRPWKHYSRTVIMESTLDSLIDAAGWHAWNDTTSTLGTLYYAEYRNSGPGANTSGRVSWPGYHIIEAATAEDFTVEKFLSGDQWLPATGIPYIGRLLSPRA